MIKKSRCPVCRTGLTISYDYEWKMAHPKSLICVDICTTLLRKVQQSKGEDGVYGAETLFEAWNRGIV